MAYGLDEQPQAPLYGPPAPAPGLDAFDPGPAATNLAAVGQPMYGPPDPAAAPALEQQIAADQRQLAADAPMAPTSEAAPIGAPGPQALPEAAPAGVSGAPLAPVAAGAPVDPALAPIPPLPKRPALTGDHQTDVQNGILFERALDEHRAILGQHQAAIGKKVAGVEDVKANAELEAERARAAAEKVEQERYAAERKERQDAIDAAVRERAEAAKSLEDARWGANHHTGAQIVAIIAGGLGAAISNMGRAQLHMTPDAQNEALVAINKRMEQDESHRQQRLAHASEALLQARYGFKDSAENHRAALNDLDADTSSKYRLIAKETESQLRRAGAGSAEIAQNAIVLDAMSKAQAAETAIHEREEGQQVKREQNAATLAMSGAHLNLSERIAAATEALGRGHLSLARSEADRRKAEFDQRERDRLAAARAAAEAKKGKAGEDLEKRAYRDPDTDEVKGYAGTPKAAQALSEKVIASRAYSASLRALADDIEKNGHVGSGTGVLGTGLLSTEAGKRREQLHSEAVARGRKALDLGVSNANMQLEHSSIGGSGAGLHGMGSPDVLRDIAKKNDEITEQRVRSQLGGATDAEKANSRPPAEAPRAPVVPKVIPGADAQKMLEAHGKGDKRFDGILKSKGLI